MADQTTPFPLLTAAQISALPERTHQHRYNPNGVRLTRSLGDAVGMRQLGVHLVRVPAGRDSTEYHRHAHDEEWIYVLSGRGLAEIDGRKVEVGAGDFMGFVAGSVPHGLTNPHAEDLVYLLGGTRQSYDVVDYPRAGIRSYMYDGRRDNVDVTKLREP